MYSTNLFHLQLLFIIIFFSFYSVQVVILQVAQTSKLVLVLINDNKLDVNILGIFYIICKLATYLVN